MLQDQEILLEMGLKLDDGTIEYVPIGYFTASNVKKEKYHVSIEAYGRLMSRGGGLYVSNLTWPAKVSDVITEISNKMGVPIRVLNVDTTGTIDVPMIGLQYREAIQYIAGLLGGYSTEDSGGNIVIAKYALNESVSIDTDFCYAFPLKNDAEYEVTGVEVVVSGDSSDEEGNTTEGEKYTYGSFINVVASNPYMNESLFENCKANVLGFRYMPAEVEFLGDLRIEPWDYLEVIDDDETIAVPCMGVTHTWDGGVVTVVNAPGESESETEMSHGGPLTVKVERTYQELLTAKKIIATKISAEEADLRYATIANLLATDAKIVNVTGEFLNFKNGEFQVLKSAAITTENLEAEVGKFGYVTADGLSAAVLNAGFMTVQNAEMSFATIDSLNAANASVKSLSGEFALFRSGEFHTLQTDVADIQSAYMDEAKVNTLIAAKGYLTEAQVNNLVANKGYITSLETNNLLSGYVKASTLEADYIKATEIQSEYATIENLNAVSTKVNDLTAIAITTENLSANIADFGFITAKEVSAGYATIANLNSVNAAVGTLNSKIATIENAYMDEASVNALIVAKGYFTEAQVESLVAGKGYLTEAQVNTLVADKGYITTIETNTLLAKYATIVQLNSANGNITNLQTKVATIEKAYMDEAEVESLVAEKGFITELATEELLTGYVKTEDLEADYITAESIASKYATISNLNALNATVSNLNSKAITTDNLSAKVADLGYAKVTELEAVDGKIDDLTAIAITTETLESEVAEFGYLKANTAAATYATITNLNATNTTVNNLKAIAITTENLSAKVATLGYLKANDLEAEVGEFGYLKAADLEAEVAEFGYIKTAAADAKYATITNLTALNTTVSNLSAKAITTDNLSAKVATLGYLKAVDLEAEVGEFGYLKATDASATYATIANLNATNTTIKNLGATYATIDLANVKNGSITTAMIGTGVVGTAQIADGSITDAKIVGLTASKITAGTLDAGTIDVINLNAANITVGTINGHQIASGAIDTSKLTSGLSSTITTASENASQALTDASEAQDAADDAQKTADGKNTVFYQASAPSTSGRKTNDIWFDTDDGNKMYYWNGSAWTARQFGTNAIANAAITNALIADATIQSGKIANLDAGKITTGTLSADRIAALSIVAAKIASGAITADKLGASAVTAGKIASGAITSDKIVSGAITTDKLAANAVTANEIAAGTITSNELATGAVTAAKINVSSLSALSANLGTVTAGVLQSENYAESNYSVSSDGTVTGAVLEGLKIDLNNKAYYTPQITIKDNYINLKGHLTIGTRKTGTVGAYSFSQGYQNLASGRFSHVEGMGSVASGAGSHAEGMTSAASGEGSHAEGNSIASGIYSHAEGYETIASGIYSHAEGRSSEASGGCSHAENQGATASGDYSHAEGYVTIASGGNSHAEGSVSEASGDVSHAEGYGTIASGDYSHTEGYCTQADANYQHVQGKYNIVDADGIYAHIVGNGKSSARSNAHTLDWSGNAWFAGNVRVGANNEKLAIGERGFYYIEGTGDTAGTWLGSHDDITEYFDGLTILYKVGIAGVSGGTTLNINNLGAIAIMRNVSSAVTTHYGVNSVVLLTYTTDDGTGYWKIADYDANSYAYVRQYYTTASNNYPLLSKYDAGITTTTSYVTKYTRYSNKFYINPSTGVLTAPTFAGDLTGNADTATKATQDGDGNVISSTYSKAGHTHNYLPLSGGTLTGEILISTGTTQSATKGIKWSAINSKNPYIGYALNQTDGTFLLGSLLGTNYQDGLAIGGGSGNLLWKGAKVITASDTASTSANGLMTTAMVTKLNNIEAGANAYTHPSYTARTGVPTANETLKFGGTFKVSQPVSDATGHITAINSRTYTMPSDRLFTTLVPSGTQITSSADSPADLNTTTYLKVGRYYCSQNAQAATIKNCPLSTAFMMEVYSPLSTTIDNETTGTWVYRIRKITHYNTGIQYIQYCYAGATAGTWTYGDWYVVPRSKFTLDTADTNGGSATLGSTTKPVYVGSDGTLTACSSYAGGTAVTLNGASKAGATASLYAPTAVGSSGNVLISAGSGAPMWKSLADAGIAASKHTHALLNQSNGGQVGLLYEASDTTLNYFKPYNPVSGHKYYLGSGNYPWHGLYLANDQSIYGIDNTGAERIIFTLNANNNLVVGYGNYTNKNGKTNIYGGTESNLIVPY